MHYGIIVGRFQVPLLHEGHCHLFDEVIKRSDKVVVMLGCIDPMNTAKVDYSNPLVYAIRKGMILERYPNVATLPLYDQEDDPRWVKELDSMLHNLGDHVTLFGSRDSFGDCYMKHKGYYPFVQIPEKQGFSGTEVRKNIKFVNNAEFRTAMIYTIQNYIK